MEFRITGLRAHGLEFRGCGAEGLEFTVKGSSISVSALGFGVWVLGWVWDLGSADPGGVLDGLLSRAAGATKRGGGRQRCFSFPV